MSSYLKPEEYKSVALIAPTHPLITSMFHMAEMSEACERYCGTSSKVDELWVQVPESGGKYSIRFNVEFDDKRVNVTIAHEKLIEPCKENGYILTVPTSNFRELFEIFHQDSLICPGKKVIDVFLAAQIERQS